MLMLTLLRHAKSDWGDDSLEDFDRPLAPRGLKAAPIMGRALKTRGPTVDLALCSTSQRTRETLDLVLKELSPDTPEVIFSNGLYHALFDNILDHVVKHAQSAKHVLVVGHNPGLEILAAQLAHTGNPDEIADLNAKFPTAALAQFAFDCTNWSDITNASSHLTHFLTPHSVS